MEIKYTTFYPRIFIYMLILLVNNNLFVRATYSSQYSECDRNLRTSSIGLNAKVIPNMSKLFKQNDISKNL
jgi:hypothetical protein